MNINKPGFEGRHLKNTPEVSQDDRKKLYCPLCIYQGKDIFVYFDPKEKRWKCPECGYVVPPNMDAVERSQLTAGNEKEVETPYAKSVSYKRVLQNRPKLETYNNPMDAWNEL